MQQDLQIDDASTQPGGRSARLALFGPPPPIEGDCAEAYDEVLARISGAVKPAHSPQSATSAPAFWQNEASNAAVIAWRPSAGPHFGRTKPVTNP